MKISKKGSIYQLAKLGSNDGDFTKSDLCTTSKRVFFGLLYSMFIIAMAVGALVVVGYIPFYTIMWYITGTALMTEAISIFIAFLVLCLIGLSLYGIYRAYKAIKKETIKQIESIEFTRKAYRGFKDKVCFLVEVE